jgi:hypothetical protein
MEPLLLTEWKAMISRHSTSSSLYMLDNAAWIPAFLHGSIRRILTLPASPFGFHCVFSCLTITTRNTHQGSSLHGSFIPESAFSSGLNAIHCVPLSTSITPSLHHADLPALFTEMAPSRSKDYHPCDLPHTHICNPPSIPYTKSSSGRKVLQYSSPRHQLLPILTRPSSEEFRQRIPNLRAIFGSKLTPPSRAAFELAGLNNNMIYDSDLAMARGSAKIECQVHQVSCDRQIGHAFLLFILSGKSTSLSVLLSQWSLLLSLPFLYIERYTISIPHNKLQRYLQQHVSPPPLPSRLH